MNLTPKAIGRERYYNYNDLQLPITLLEKDINGITKKLKNIVDILWQTGGSNECPQNTFNKIFDTFSIE